MKVNQFMAKQYAGPSGLFGRLVTSRLLNRANRLSNYAVYDALEIERGNRVLDIGFGGGELLFNIARNSGCGEVCGVEKSEEMIQRANAIIWNDQELKVVKLMLGDISALPVSGNAFDRVCSVNTIYFWPNLCLGSQELARVTTNNGRVVLGYGSGEKLSQSGYTENGFKFYKPDTIHTAMEKADLKLVHNKQLHRKNKDSFNISVYCKSER